ncbi:myosin heavy chain 95F isoform X2 [Schistocerca gregaria]|uniref:myosin heavy chain 95F isoform X2 n=1 Tax=Schistocerca gregaria TaxID=7010 RepID=UPI00211DF537|nr:myosin heavy chain 95F isoform X2 [Schistocerca gregaria]XP_049829323.1 myosin heavy chain 95F isoform X2 [Schistocerca gregaria]XP_049829324.1 myosin heavy chain 95F isoform X2 [Schistocerca gregaria]
MNSMEKQKVWVPDPVEGFILGQIIDLGYSGQATVLPFDSKHSKQTCSLDRIHYAEDNDSKEVDDNCGLMYLNPATLLHNVRLRYYKDKIYTYVANILLAVNPYFEIKDLYSKNTIKSYQGKSLGVMPPHVFAIGDKAFRDMKVMKQSQSIIVSGESGAGKTESTKYLLRYLCDLWGTTAGPIEQKILDANPIMEAFGNAKTTRNNNSSRFGKFMEVHFDNKYQVVGGYISHYLLEKSRICVQGPEERNYHVFYLLCAGAPDQLRAQLNITKPDDFHYLKQGCTQYFVNNTTEKKLNNSQKSQSQIKKGGLKDPLLDDVQDFTTLDQALSRIGLDDAERLNIYTTVASVLHLGNVSFEENPEDTKGGCRITAASEKSLTIASKLMGMDPEELRQALVSKVMQTSRGGLKGTVIMVPLKVYEANNARDALAKALYSKLFDYIVQRINKSIPFKASSYYIGVLDIAGFEYFTVNSFEQFCINYCNEKLQQFFNQRILKDDQELYQKESLNVPKIEFRDNQDCIDLIETKASGIFNLLDEESKLPKPSSEHFTNEVHRHWANHFRLAKTRDSKLKAHREIRDSEGFMIRHFAGAVCYQTAHFVEKNNDALHASLEGLILECKNKFLQGLFPTADIGHQKGKLAFDSVGMKFKNQLSELMEKLKSTGTNFIRCIKPNQKMVDHQFEGGSVLSQLECSGMVSVLELMQNGFPSRVPFSELHSMYNQHLPEKLRSLPPRMFCKALLKALGMTEDDYRFGVTKVFFRPGKFSEFDAVMKSDPENISAMVNKIKKWLLSSQWKKAQWCSLSVIKLKYKILYRRRCLIVIQKNVRMFLVKKKYQPRIKGLTKINRLKDNLSRMEKIIPQLKKDKESSAAEVKKLHSDIETALKKIKTDDSITTAQVDSLHLQLMNRINEQMSQLQTKLQQQKNAEEQERLRKIQEEMERERKRKEEEERKKREEEENRRKKAEMEARRKAEEEARKKQEEEDRRAAAALQKQLEKEALEDAKYREQLEQEKRDHELALRLAQETNEQIEDMPQPSAASRPVYNEVRSPTPSKLNRSELARSIQGSQGKQKYDLSKWKYSELRDTINTSCDIELLEACRVEFHRRLKVYHAWKAKNRKRTTMMENERAPRSIMDAATKTPKVVQKAPISTSTQRYFRIPFIRPPTVNNNQGEASTSVGDKRGLWYAHFDGQYVARQMELHPDKPPILLVAGIDDMQMCELSLEETGLTRRRGAEILEQEFEKEWERNGGKPYVKAADRRRQ